MTDGPSPAETPVQASPRPGRQRPTFVMLAGVLAIIGALAAGYYFAMRPVTLRIAVGPANSDDLKVIQNLTLAFNNQRNSVVRLRPVQTDGALTSATLLGEGHVGGGPILVPPAVGGSPDTARHRLACSRR